MIVEVWSSRGKDQKFTALASLWNVVFWVSDSLKYICPLFFLILYHIYIYTQHNILYLYLYLCPLLFLSSVLGLGLPLLGSSPLS